MLSKRQFWTGTWIWVLALFMLVNWGASSWYKQALEEQKKSIGADFESEQKANSAGDKVPRYDLSCGENLPAYWSSVPDARQTRLVILSGMSQMHTINNRQPGDELICQWLDDALANKGTRVWGFAAPNLCNEEALFQLVSLLSDPAKHPHIFIYGLCFDKMRNTDLRVGYQQFLREHPEIQKAYAQAADKYAARYPMAAAKMRLTLTDLSKSEGQRADSLESQLRADVGHVVPLVAARKDLNAWAQIQFHSLRDVILNIKSDTKRPVIQSRYDMNVQFLKMLVDLSRANGVEPLFYVIPLNPQADNPYVPAEYENFKREITDYCTRQHIAFANFENVVPAEDWGKFFNGQDFKHFNGAGHKQTSEAILRNFEPILTGKAPTDTSAGGTGGSGS
jgi:hypothetical protein